MDPRESGDKLMGCKKCQETPSLETADLPDGRTLYRYDHFEHQNWDHLNKFFLSEEEAFENWNMLQSKKR